jgi:phosphate starvation-inducible protein PhoH
MFNETDVVRHHLVQRIIHAYEDFKARDDRQLTLQLESESARAAADLQTITEKAKPSATVQQ